MFLFDQINESESVLYYIYDSYHSARIKVYCGLKNKQINNNGNIKNKVLLINQGQEK